MIVSRTATTVYVIGKCPTKGCANRRRHTFPGTIQVDDRLGTSTSWTIPGPAGSGYPVLSPYRSYGGGRWGRPSGYPQDTTYDRVWLAAIRGLGWTCTDHDRFMVLTPVKGVVNVNRSCDGRCMAATGGDCECSCGGANHGASWS